MAGGRVTGSGLSGTSPSTGGRALIILIVRSLSLFTASVRGGETGVLGTIRSGFSTVTMPFRLVGSAVTTPFYGLGNIFANLTADQERLSELKAENERLVARNAELEESEQTARRLESLLGLQSLYNLQSTGARIISGSTDSWSSTVTIDKGTAAGIAVGMPVTDSNGAIGQIIRCGAASSTVRLVTDENSSVSAMVQSSRAQGVLRGSVDGTLHLTLVRTDQNVEVGDTVVTSGLGGVFPKGLPLGTVTSVERTAGALYYDIEVEPLSSTESFEEVLVITSLTEDQKPTAEEVAQADKQDSASSGAKSTKSDDSSDSNDSGDGSAEQTDESAGGDGTEDESEDQSQDEG